MSDKEITNEQENETVMYMHSRCHTDMPTWTKIDFERNVAVVECCVCDKEVITLRLFEPTEDDENE